MAKIDPFATETLKLRVPVKLGERTVSELRFRPPKFKDALRTDSCPPNSVAAAMALMSSLTGEPESILGELVPEDAADCLVIVARTNMRFFGQLNLFEGQEEAEDPTAAERNTQQQTLPPPSAESQAS